MDGKYYRFRTERIIVFGLTMILLSGCSVIQGLTGGSSPPDGAEQTAIAQQVIALAETEVAKQVVQSAEPVQPVQPVQVEQPTQTALPTYTPLPTYTSVPTFTPLPTYTLIPTFTAPAVVQPTSYGAATPNPEQRGCCTLRVRNMFRRTYWIGAALPYGGNLIKPLWYVEFYPRQPTWMRIWVCRYRPNMHVNFEDYNQWLYAQQWDGTCNWSTWNYWLTQSYRNFCFHRDVYVDETLVQISVP